MTDTPIVNATKKVGYNKNYKKKKNKKSNKNDVYSPIGDPIILSKAIEELGLKEKTLEILKRGNVNTVLDLIKYRERELYRIQNFNKKNLIDVTERVGLLNLSFRPEEVKQINDDDSVNENKAVNENRPLQAAPNIKPVNDSRDNRIRVMSNGRIDDRSRATDNRNRPQQNDNRPNRNNNQQRNNGNLRTNDNHKNIDQSRINDNRNKSQDDVLSLIGKKPPFKYTQLIEEKLLPDALIKFNKDNKYGFKDMKGKVIIPSVYDEVFNFKEDLACVELNGLYGYIDKQNKMIIPPTYELAMSFSEGLACVTISEKSGYIDTTGNIVIELKFENATSFEEDMARVKLDGKWVILTKDGKIRNM